MSINTFANTNLRKPAIAWVAALLLALAAAPAAAQDVSEQDQIRFEQDKALAHMQELEERMFRLAELIREAQTDDATRLMMGVREAREQLIAEQMREAAVLLSQMDLSRATHEQQEALRKLERLKQLLLATDLDLALRLEQLRQVRQMRDAVARLAEREAQQARATDAQTEEQEPNERALDELRDTEQRQQQDAAQLARQAGQMGEAAATAADAMAGAADAMDGAAGRLAEQAARDAAAQQREAQQRLAEADAALAQLEQQLLDELRDMIRQQMMDQLEDMLAQQRQVNQATADLAPRADEGRRAVLLAIRALAGSQDKVIDLADDAIDLLEETGFSIALPPAMRAVRLRMAGVSAALQTARADEVVMADQERIEADLAGLLDALREQKENEQREGDGQAGEAGGEGQRRLAMLLAELKMLRQMQVSVQADTAALEQRRQAGGLDEPALRRQADALREQQEAIRKALDELHARLAAEQGAARQ